MALIIDGYNLLHTSGLFGKPGPGNLQRSRQALIQFLIESLTPAEIAGTTLVFDAAAAPPGLPDTLSRGGLTIRFARGYADADALIEELIQADTSPRRLVVVSGDHRLHRAARRRRARAQDSDQWYEEMLSRRRNANAHASLQDARPQPVPLPGEVEFWLRQFANDGAEVDSSQDLAGVPDDPIFPPGYAEDEPGLPHES